MGMTKTSCMRSESVMDESKDAQSPATQTELIKLEIAKIVVENNELRHKMGCMHAHFMKKARGTQSQNETS